MLLQELNTGKDIIIQFAWGKHNVEFHSIILDKDGDALFASPYIRDGKVLKLKVSMDHDVICNIYSEDSYAKKRVSWRNVQIETVDREGAEVYKISTMLFNRRSVSGERREFERIHQEKNGEVIDLYGRRQNVTIHDISENGLSLYASNDLKLDHTKFVVMFEDEFQDHNFSFKLDCNIVRTSVKEDKVFFGCRITSRDHDYQLYNLLKRLVH